MDAVEGVGQPAEEEHDGENDGIAQTRLLQFRRVRARGIARSAANYLQMEAAATTASLLCRTITTAEQEMRTKQRARVWRQDVGKVKARHVRTLAAVDQGHDECPLPHDAASQVLGALLGHERRYQEGVSDDATAQKDILEDRLYESLLKEKFAL
ncbi:hypothetical protein AURDEDRAFT_167274 [Auricularia subglabra TFB-10046 SS5]|nr:hypothetical protein AURDEDRAFT_167274 [Auricularia subglabra TFB-10046 SS5]